METPANPAPAPAGRISELIGHLMTAISSCSLYSEIHPVVREFSVKALDILAGLYAGDSINITLIGDSLIFNDIPFVEKGVHISNFIKRLKRKKIDRIIIKRSPDIGEVLSFVISLTGREKVPSTDHISVGVIEIRLKGSGTDAAALLDSGISKVRETLSGLTRFRKLDMVGLEDAVIDFLSVLKKELNVLRIVSPVKSHNEYTYVHATNVSVLTIFQAEALGFKGENLRDIGLAGLLHDVGKMFVSNTVLDKQGKLDEEEWNEMRMHPVYGALYLSKLPDTQPLAAIVAFEHHMKYNGTGYPDTKRSGRNQHIVSQMVAIADFFDALRTERPYRKPLPVPAIISMMQEGSGKDFNPMLVENFLSSLSLISDKQ
ncbi:MAG: HD-GYP domain-containing protein [Thermodesulfovibrionales bacterium]